MNRTTLTSMAWLAAAGLGIGFAMWYPTESTVMGQLPAHSTQTLTRAPVSLPQGLPSDRIPVLGEPNSPDYKTDTEKRLLGRYTADIERAKMLPMFVDKAAFAKATGLHSTARGYAVVFNRQGEVLARVEGPYDPDKAIALRETLAAATK